MEDNFLNEMSKEEIYKENHDIEHNLIFVKFQETDRQIDLLFEKVASLRESIIKLENNGQNDLKS